VGLGPTVRSQLDGVYVRDLERDFTLFKASVLGAGIWRPVRELQVRAGPDYEHNDIHLFQAGNVAQYLSMFQGNTDLARLLRVPDGTTDVVAASVVVHWDRRDTPFNAHQGTYVTAGFEQVNSFPVRGTADSGSQYEAHLFRLTQTAAAYLPLSSTVESMRGWLPDTFVPQEYADHIAADASKASTDPTKFNVGNIPLRGGNFMVNPRIELRFPIRSPIEGAIFGDLGNLWTDPRDFVQRPLVMRADVGAGVRVDTPVGPLVFDYGINVARRSYEDVGAFHFAIGLF
jgi:outer membrane protein assembly factor BamA